MAIEQKRVGAAGVARPPQEDFLRIQDLLGLCLGKWWWFVISLGVTLSVAVLYLMMTPSVYTRSAAVMIKDNSKGGVSLGRRGGVCRLGPFQEQFQRL